VADVKFFFLVGGYDYEGGGAEKGQNHDGMCTGRVKQWIQRLNRSAHRPDTFFIADTILRFIRFSVETGEIRTLERTFLSGRGVTRKLVKESDWKLLVFSSIGDPFDPNTFVTSGRVVSDNIPPLPFRAIDRTSDYKAPDFHTFNQSAATSNIISITDVYESIRKAPVDSVLDFSVFSHGWIQGPLLVNSSNLLNDPNVRDPDDKDGRAALDFAPTMGAPPAFPPPVTRLFRFMSSFDSRAIMHTWGCTFDIETVVVQQAQRMIKKKQVTDDTDLEFNFAATHTDWTKRYAVVDPAFTFLPSDTTILTMTKKFSELKRFLRRRLAQSYPFQFMDANSAPDRSARGALPGTYAEDEKTGFGLMKVCARKHPPECTSGFANVFDFYKKQIGITVDDRGYAIFDVPTMTKLKADIAADPP
jgi:hypothetical protein